MLSHSDLHYVVSYLPRDIRSLFTANPEKLFVGGGFIRAQIAGETPSDIDLFTDSKENASKIADELMKGRPDSKMWKTKNAITVLTPGRLPVQFITRWTFENAADVVRSFDFTVCQAAIWVDVHGNWRSCSHPDFYLDLAARRLVYTYPDREEEAGGSMMRAIKYIKRGYNIQAPSLAGVISRLGMKVRDSKLAETERGYAQVVCGLLREVDPLTQIDGIELVDGAGVDADGDEKAEA